MSQPNWIIQPGHGWGPLELGQSRATIVERLDNEEIEFEQDEHNSEWLEIRECLAVISGRHQQLWHAAPRAAGTVVAIENDQSPGESPLYVVEYRDRQGAVHQVRWTVADVYIPRQVGETVEVPYLEEAPDRPLGPARVRDAGLVTFLPLVLVAVSVYSVILFMDHRRRNRRRAGR